MNDEYIKNRMKDIVLTTPENTSIGASQAAERVMQAYQNANKWLDSIKETLLMEFGCVFFSNYIHELAHTMPARFDKFGDILHSINMKVPYPATERLMCEPTDVSLAIVQVLSILDDINVALKSYVDQANTAGERAVAISTEELIVDLSKEYPPLYRMQKAYSMTGDPIKFDHWVAQYITHKGSLID